MIILVTGAASWMQADKLIKMVPQCGLVQTFLLSPFYSPGGYVSGRQHTFAWLLVCVAKTLKMEVILCTGGAVLFCQQQGTASSQGLGVPGIWRKLFYIAHVLSFRLQIYCSVYSEVQRWRNDYVCNCWLFSLPVARKDFFYPLYKLGDVLEERQMQTLHAVMTKDSWIITCRERQFCKGKTQAWKHLLVNSGGNAGVIVRHTTCLKAGDSGCEREVSRCPDVKHSTLHNMFWTLSFAFPATKEDEKRLFLSITLLEIII